MMKMSLSKGILTIVIGALVTADLRALPFNDDMVDSQLKTGQVMRAKPAESVPVGSLTHRIEKKEDALELQNPIKPTAQSVRNGERLFMVNCAPCHGNIATGEKAVETLSKSMPAVDLTHESYKNRPDGLFYATIEFGGLAIMPRLGWKIAPEERWDIVNYIRKVQSGK